jgi:hypothetical protein
MSEYIGRDSDYITFTAVACVTVKDNPVTINTQKFYSSKNFIDKIEFASLKNLLPKVPPMFCLVYMMILSLFLIRKVVNR